MPSFCLIREVDTQSSSLRRQTRLAAGGRAYCTAATAARCRTAAALEGVLDLAAAPAFIEGGGAAVASDLCPTALVPEGIMQQLEQLDQEASQPGVDNSVEMAPSS